MRKIILYTYIQRWGVPEHEDDNDKVDMGQLIISDLYERHYKKAKIATWIKGFHSQRIEKLKQSLKSSQPAQHENMKGSVRQIPDEVQKLKVVEEEKHEENNQSKGVEQSSQKVPVLSLNELPPAPETPTSHVRPKSAFGKSPGKEISLEPFRERTPTKKDIKKKVVWFKEADEKPLKQDRNLMSFEDFAEFDKLAPMVKTKVHEVPKLLDMNQVFAEKIKKRYRSTDRFIRVDQYTTLTKLE